MNLLELAGCVLTSANGAILHIFPSIAKCVRTPLLLTRSTDGRDFLAQLVSLNRGC